MVEYTMEPLAWLRKQLEEADVDLLREMVATFVQGLMGAEADAVCGALYGERSPERVNRRNGYRPRDFDSRVGTMSLAIPKLREGSNFPDWLLTPRQRAERALVAVVAECYVKGVSTRRVDGLIKTLGIEGISKSQVSELVKSLGEGVQAFRSRPLDAGSYTFVWLDALSLKCREGTDRERRGCDRHRGERRRSPGDPRPRGPDLGGRRRVDGVPPGPGGPGASRRPPGGLRRPQRAG